MLDHLLIEKDFWEDDPARLIGRPDITTILVVRRTPIGIACHLEMRAENRTCELPSAATSVSEALAWLGSYDTAAHFANRFGFDDSDALALCKHWGSCFTAAIQRWERHAA